MKAIGSSFSVNFRRALCNNITIRTYVSDIKQSDAKGSNKKQSNNDLLNSIKPHARSGILSVVEKDDNGFPSYLILKETSPLLRLVLNLLVELVLSALYYNNY